MNNDISL